jgi:hypothetical protein
MKPPSADELTGTPPRMLDEEVLLKNFLGKTDNNALQMFQQNPAVTEDFAYMRPSGLLYYLPAVLTYLKSAESSANWEFASGLLCALSIQFGIHKVGGPALSLMQQIAEYCRSNRAKFDFDDQDLTSDYMVTILGADSSYPVAPNE